MVEARKRRRRLGFFNRACHFHHANPLGADPVAGVVGKLGFLQEARQLGDVRRDPSRLVGFDRNQTSD
jgi:hypothetical protein